MVTDDGHTSHWKHLQLGVEVGKDGVAKGDDRKMLSSEHHDDVWENATTVERFKEDIESLARKTGA